MNSKLKNDLFINTPLIESLELRQFSPNRVYLKLDNCQPSGSFKLRGISRLCQHAVNSGYNEIIASSGGNAGLAAAHSARLLGIKCQIVVPKLTSKLMKERIGREGADIQVFGDVWDEANEKALKVVEEKKQCFYVHPFDNPILWSGHSTMIDEIAQQLDTIPSMIITCCGGGGLLCGVIEGMRRHKWTSVPVLAMETRGADSLNACIKGDGQPITPVRLSALTSIATSLGALEICKEMANNYNESKPPVLSHLVDDKEAVNACLQFADQHRILVEPACGASLAALYTGLVQKLFEQNSGVYSDGPVVVIICGGASVTLDLLKQYKNKFNV